MTVVEIYNQTIAPLSADERIRLAELILDHVAPEPPNSVRDEAHLEKLLLEGYEGEAQPVTESTWAERRARARNRQQLRKP